MKTLSSHIQSDIKYLNINLLILYIKFYNQKYNTHN